MRKGQRVSNSYKKKKKNDHKGRENSHNNIIYFYEIVWAKVNDQPTFFFVEANK